MRKIFIKNITPFNRKVSIPVTVNGKVNGKIIHNK